ncbi:MAG: ABC transporter permease [Chlamydiia bacterium]|nr:ABC transporter permease [Chlamydiia bacterium]
MFELSVALKYLLPRKRSVSTALISAMSILVISLVVWLVLVFLSVTAGIENSWLKKLTSLHAPIRISPTDRYYQSYYYQIDTLSAQSNYTPKTIGEKRETLISDPYTPDQDPEIPLSWPKADRLLNGQLTDPVKIAFERLSALKKNHPDLKFQDYEIGGALLRLTLQDTHTSLSQMSFLLTIDDQNPHLGSLLLPPDTTSVPHATVTNGTVELPVLPTETPILIAKNYRDGGARIGDRGTLSFISAQGAFSSEQRLPVRVVGFYDPGIMSIGNKCILVPSSITRLIHASTQTFSPDGTPTNGIFVWTDHFKQAKEIQKAIEDEFEDAHIATYWKVSTYEDFEFSKDLMLQFKSDRTLFLLIACIILVVACSNIISLLVLLVNDKKKEIAILQSMGATFRSIAAIFGTCGIAMGAISCFLGSIAAIFTLHHIDSLVSLLSTLQGRAAFNPAFFGQSLPNQLSFEALLFVLIVTPLLCLAAGIIPAIKASRIRPATTLRSE